MAVTGPLDRKIEDFNLLFLGKKGQHADLPCLSPSGASSTAYVRNRTPSAREGMPGSVKLKGRLITRCGQDSDACSINWRSRLVSVRTSAPRRRSMRPASSSDLNS